MKKSLYSCYMGINVLSGSASIGVPNKFVSTANINDNKTLKVSTIIDDAIVGYFTASILQNNIFFRRAIWCGQIANWEVPGKLIRDFGRYISVGNEEKATNLAAGYSKGVFLNLAEESSNILSGAGEITVGIKEQKEKGFVTGYHYKRNGQDIFSIPDNLFVMLDDKGIPSIDVRPEFLREAKKNLYDNLENPSIRAFSIRQKVITCLEDACTSGDIPLRNDLVKSIIADNSYLLKRDGN